MENRKPIIDVLLKPKDFDGNSFFDNKGCPLARAVKRKFKTGNVQVRSWCLSIRSKRFAILNDGFGIEDYHQVKKEYARKNRKWDHYVQVQEI